MVSIIIVPTALKALAEKCTTHISPGSEGDSFTVPLWPIGKTDGGPSHWASLPGVSDEAWKQIELLAASPPFLSVTSVTSCEPWDCEPAFEALLQDLGLVRAEVVHEGQPLTDFQ